MDERHDHRESRRGRYAFDEAARRTGGFPTGFAVPLPSGWDLERLLRPFCDATRRYREASHRLLDTGGRRKH